MSEFFNKMKSKKSCLIGIIVGSAILLLAVFFAFSPEVREKVKPQTVGHSQVIGRVATNENVTVLQQETVTNVKKKYVFDLELKPAFPND